MIPLKELFLLDPEVIFLNHGSFGATPVPVFNEYQRWQLVLEQQPVQFLGRDIFDLFRSSRQKLAEYLGAVPSDLVFVPNATFAVNIVARSLDLGPGDEIIISNHEYGACENVWLFLSRKKGLKIVRAEIPLPLPSDTEIIEDIWNKITDRTRLIFLSQITSPTAVRLPVEKICLKARQDEIQIFIDGAHAPGQLDLDLKKIGADYYTGNCHKWLMAPKGAGFLYVHPERQSLIEPLVVSWGWGENSPFKSDSKFLQEQEWWGTIDPAAYLSVPAAISFLEEHKWSVVRDQCRGMLTNLLGEIESLTGLPSIYGENQANYLQLGAAELSKGCEPEKLQSWLYENYKIEIPVIPWEDRWFIRPSVQGYNTQEDLDMLVKALKKYLK